MNTALVPVSMQPIQQFNCRGMCAEQYCSRPYKFFSPVVLNGMRIIIALCTRHAQEFEDYYWKNKKERFDER